LKSSQEDIILLEKYLNGRLSADEKSAVESRLSGDKNLSDDLDALRLVKAATRVSVLKEKMHMLQVLDRGTVSRPSKKRWIWVLVVFFVLALGYLLYNIVIKDDHQVDAAYAHVFETEFDRNLILHKTMRSTVQPDELTNEQRRAYELYSLQLFEEAMPLLEALWQEKKDTLALFYLGVSRVGAGQTEEGLKTLRREELQKYDRQMKTIFNNKFKTMLSKFNHPDYNRGLRRFLIM
jgi:hypothetical protein